MNLSTELGTLQFTMTPWGQIARVEWIEIRQSRGWVARGGLAQLCFGWTFEEPPTAAEEVLDETYQVVPERVKALASRLADSLRTGDPLEACDLDVLDFSNVSDFQRKVFEATVQIPHGETRSYAWVAERIRSPFASRAVGQALKRNPFPILVPCHRVIASCGAVGGFLGREAFDEPETWLKRQLLELERSYRNPVFPFLESFAPGALCVS